VYMKTKIRDSGMIRTLKWHLQFGLHMYAMGASYAKFHSVLL